MMTTVTTNIIIINANMKISMLIKEPENKNSGATLCWANSYPIYWILDIGYPVYWIKYYTILYWGTHSILGDSWMSFRGSVGFL